MAAQPAAGGKFKMNMTSRIKQGIRYMAADRRLSKKIYPKDINVRKLCKLNEERDQLTKDIDKFFIIMKSNGFRPGIDAQNPIFFKDFDLINICEKRRERIIKQISRIESFSGISVEDALHQFYILNKGRGSQSF